VALLQSIPGPRETTYRELGNCRIAPKRHEANRQSLCRSESLERQGDVGVGFEERFAILAEDPLHDSSRLIIKLQPYAAGRPVFDLNRQPCADGDLTHAALALHDKPGNRAPGPALDWSIRRQREERRASLTRGGDLPLFGPGRKMGREHSSK
jgi:hypothetical protein